MEAISVHEESDWGKYKGHSLRSRQQNLKLLFLVWIEHNHELFLYTNNQAENKRSLLF